MCGYRQPNVRPRKSHLSCEVYCGMKSSLSVKTNTSRGRKFRAKRKRYEEELQLQVHALQEQVHKPETTRVLDDCQLLLTPYSESGSVTKMIREYFRLFRFGLFDRESVLSSKSLQMAPKVTINKIEQQETLIRAIMDEDVMVGDNRGPNASIEQWRLYTLAQDLIRLEVQRVETVYFNDYAMINVHVNCHFRFYHNTFELMFPGACQNLELVNKFLHREVMYRAVFHYQFTDEGKILSESVEGDFVQGFLEAGCLLEDIAVLMRFCVITSSYLIPLMKSKECITTEEKLTLKYLLSEETD